MPMQYQNKSLPGPLVQTPLLNTKISFLEITVGVLGFSILLRTSSGAYESQPDQLTEVTAVQEFVHLNSNLGGGPRVVVSTAAFHARVRGSVPGLGGLKETKMFLPHPRVKVSIVGSLRDREVACSASDRQGSNFESCVWRTVSSQSSHHP